MEKRDRFSLTALLDKAGVWWGFLGPNGIVCVVMAFIFWAFEPVAKYGWSAIALAALATALLFILVASFGLFAWSKFRPRSPDTHLPNGAAPSPGNDIGMHSPLTEDRVREIASETIRSLTTSPRVTPSADHIELLTDSVLYMLQTTAALLQFEDLDSKIERSLPERIPYPATSEDGEQLANTIEDRGMSIAELLKILDPKLAGLIVEKMQHAAEDVRKDPLNAIIGKSDPYCWPDEATKLEWHMVNARIDALADELRRARDRYGIEAKIDASVLNNFNENLGRISRERGADV